MNFARKSAVGFVGVAALAAATSMTTHALLARAERAKAAGQPGVAEDRVQEAKAAFLRLSAEGRLQSRQPNVSYRDIVGIEDIAFDGRIGLAVDVECWHGENILPRLPDAERANRLRVCVYSPDDPRRQGEPLITWESPAVDIQAGLYQERVPVSIPMPPSPRPYPVTVELVSARPIHHTPLGKAEAAFTPRSFRGKSFAFKVL